VLAIFQLGLLWPKRRRWTAYFPRGSSVWSFPCSNRPNMTQLKKLSPLLGRDDAMGDSIVRQVASNGPARAPNSLAQCDWRASPRGSSDGKDDPRERREGSQEADQCAPSGPCAGRTRMTEEDAMRSTNGVLSSATLTEQVSPAVFDCYATSLRKWFPYS